jgi:hypothetical protein
MKPLSWPLLCGVIIGNVSASSGRTDSFGTGLYLISCNSHLVFIQQCDIPSTVHLPMTQRDLNIISMVYEYEGCGVEHIRKLFFQSATDRSIPCYRRLSVLVKQQYLRSCKLLALNKYFLTPGRNARVILSRLLKGFQMKRIRIESPLYIMHKLGLCDVRVALELATKPASPFLLTEWLNESDLRRSPLSVEDPDTKKHTMLIPDAAFTLISQATGKTAAFFLEMDLGTVSLQAMRGRVRGYLLRRKNPCPVLFVVPDAKRQQAIAHVVFEEAKQLQANPTTIWMTVKAGIRAETVLSVPWVVAGATPVTFQGLVAPVAENSLVFADQGGHRG